MLKNRLNAALAIRDAYVPLKRSSDDLSLQATRCVLVLQEQRREAGLKLGTGADIVADLTRGAALIAEAMAAINSAHPKLAQLIKDAGLEAHYPYQAAYGDDETVDNTPRGAEASPQRRLSIVER